MNTYNWIISALECKVLEDGFTNLISTVHWRYNATNENGITVDTYGAQSVGSETPPVKETFVPYESITKEIIIGWLEVKIDVLVMNESLDDQIALKEKPVIIFPSLPFHN